MGDRIIISNGRPVAVPDEAVTPGAPIASEAELDAIEQERANEKLYGGWEGAVVGGAISTADAASMGAVGLGLRAAGAGETMREINKRHKVAEIAGQVVGSAVGLPGQLAGKAAGGLVKKGAVAGGIFGLQQGTHELGLDEHPLTAERVVSVLGTNTLLGVGLGAAGGAVHRAAQLGLKRGGRLLASVAQKAESGQATGGVVDDIAAHHAAVDTEGVWLAVAKDENRKVLQKAAASIRGELDDPVGLAASPHLVIKPLRRQVELFKKALADAPELFEKVAADDVKIAASIRAKVAKAAERADTVIFKPQPGAVPPEAPSLKLTGKVARRYAEWADMPLKKNGSVTVTLDEAGGLANAIENGEIAGMRRAALEKLPGAIDRAQALVDRIEVERAAAKLAGRKPYVEELGGRVAQAAGWGMMGGILPGGPAGAIGAVLASDAIGKAASFVASRLSRAVGASTKASGKAVGALLAGEKAAEKLTPNVRSFLAGRKGAAAAAGTGGLARAYKQRAEEIRNLTMLGPDGDPVMRPEARMALGRALAPVSAMSPTLADRAETVAARKVEFLSKKLPRRPDVAAISAGGPDTWQESDAEMRQWGRLAWAADNPDGVEQLLALGSITPEDAEAYREIYPERYRDLQLTIAARLPELQKKLPYRQRLALSIFTGNPVDPSLDPSICRVLQGNFEMEEGTEGGTKPKAATPNFGSVKSSESPTPAQERSA